MPEVWGVASSVRGGASGLGDVRTDSGKSVASSVQGGASGLGEVRIDSGRGVVSPDEGGLQFRSVKPPDNSLQLVRLGRKAQADLTESSGCALSPWEIGD